MKVVMGFLLLVLSMSCYAKPLLFVGTEFHSILETSKSGEIVGIGADIVYLMEQRLGHDIEILVVPFKRALQMVKDGTADGLIGPYKSQEREQYMQYTQQHIYEDPVYFYGKVDSQIEWHGDYSLFKNKIIAIVLGWFYGAEFESHRDSLYLSEVTNLDASFKLLMANRVDLTIAHPRAVNWLLEQQGIQNEIKALQPAIALNKGYFAFSKKLVNKKFIAQFDSQLTAMAKSGELTKLVQKYPDIQFSN